MARVTRKEWYRRVNEAWPEAVPALTPDEAARAAKRLYRFIRKQAFKGKVVQTSGNRYNSLIYAWKTPYISELHMVVNAERGWKALVHELSHELARDLGHGGEHARLERRMIKQVLARGWLEGKLKREPKPKPTIEDRIELRAQRVDEAIARWERKLARAEKALKKLRRKQRYYAKDS